MLEPLQSSRGASSAPPVVQPAPRPQSSGCESLGRRPGRRQSSRSGGGRLGLAGRAAGQGLGCTPASVDIVCVGGKCIGNYQYGDVLMYVLVVDNNKKAAIARNMPHCF